MVEEGGCAQFRIGIERTDRQIQRETEREREEKKVGGGEGGQNPSFVCALSFRWILLTPTSGLRPLGYWTL